METKKQVGCDETMTRPVVSYRNFIRGFILSLLVLFVLESLIINSVLFYYIWKFTYILSEFSYSGDSLVDKLSSYSAFQNMIFSGKDKGFRNLIDNTVGRLYIYNEHSCLYDAEDSNSAGTMSSESVQKGFNALTLNKVGVDVSSSGEVMFILSRMQAQKSQPWAQFVVDIGANDGIMSSNSFNFIQLGWSALLVEPQNSQLDLAKKNHMGLHHQRAGQTVQYVQAVVGSTDGTERLYLSPDIVAMESRVVTGQMGKDAAVITVPSLTVKTLVEKYAVPKYFGVLSIDTEGSDGMILRQWISLGYRPMYVIVEYLHQREVDYSTQIMLDAGYTFLVKLGYNFIYEYSVDLITKS